MHADVDHASFKKKLVLALQGRHDQSVKALEDAIVDLQSSANEETKSSVGDKYETGRAMVQLEIEKLTLQLAQLRQSKNIFSLLHTSPSSQRAQLGSVVKCTLGIVYLSYNGGELSVDGTKVICISLQSPLGHALIGKSKGDAVTINGKNVAVMEVF